MNAIDRKPPILVITVRGSTEPASGSRLLTPIARAISHRYAGEVQIPSLPYPATFESFTATYPARIDLGQSPTIGVRNLVSLLNDEATSRSQRRIVLLGWSQGAQVITDALVPHAARYAGTDAPDLDPQPSTRSPQLRCSATRPSRQANPTTQAIPPPASVESSPANPACLQDTRTQSVTTAPEETSRRKTRQGQMSRDTWRTSNGMPDRAAEFVLSRLLRTTIMGGA